MGADGDLWCGTCGRPIVPGRDNPLRCSACGCAIGPAETMASHREHGRYLCLDCTRASGEEPV